MKPVRFTPRSRERLVAIAEWTIEHFGLAQAEKYQGQLIERLAALAKGEFPHGRSCEQLIRGEAAVSGLKYVREGQHFIIFRETEDLLVVLDFVHGSRDLEQQLVQLVETGD